jgi:DNA-directed RNA polymerase specialized sigma24 family protein
MPGFKFSNQDAQEREKLFIGLYKSAFPAVAKYISKMGGSFDEAKDIFQDALVIFYEKTARGALDLKTNERAYLLGITRNLWLKTYKDNAQRVPLDGFDAEIAVDNQLAEGKILSFLQTAGKRCMDLLKSFYYDQISLAEVAGRFGFSGERSAAVQKYKCLEKVRETVKEKLMTYEDFLN